MATGGNQIDLSSARHVVGALVVAALAVLTVFAAGARVDPASAGGCPNADAEIDEASADELRRAVICLINDDRAGHDRRLLHRSGKLEEAATKHNRTMLEENCWDHDCPGEPNLGRRIKNTGYLEGASSWQYAENFGCEATPRAMLDTWLESDFQRRNIRSAAYREIGAAAARDQVGHSACDGGDEVTYTVVFARRDG